jgi:hypothetical protein
MNSPPTVSCTSSMLSTDSKRLMKILKARKENSYWILAPLTLAACGDGNIITNINGNGQINVGNTYNGTNTNSVGTDQVNTNVGTDQVGDTSSGTGSSNDPNQGNDTNRSTIFGTVNDDRNLTGTTGDDIINPLTGTDRIFAFSGADTVLLGSGSKYIDFGVDNSADTLIVNLNTVDSQSTVVNFSYNNEDSIQFMGTLYDGFDRTTLSTSEDKDDFTQNVKFQEHISSLSEDGIHSYHFGSEVAANFREWSDIDILTAIEEALEDTTSGIDGLGVLSGETQQVQNAVDGAKLLLSFADDVGNTAWCVYEETGGDLDFSGELSLILVTSITSDTTFFGEVTLPGPADIM